MDDTSVSSGRPVLETRNPKHESRNKPGLLDQPATSRCEIRISKSQDLLPICWSGHASQDHLPTTELTESSRLHQDYVGQAKAAAEPPRLGQAAPPAGPRRTIRQLKDCPAIGPAPAPSRKGLQKSGRSDARYRSRRGDPLSRFRASPRGSVIQHGRGDSLCELRACLGEAALEARRRRVLCRSRCCSPGTAVRWSAPTKPEMNHIPNPKRGMAAPGRSIRAHGCQSGSIKGTSKAEVFCLEHWDFGFVLVLRSEEAPPLRRVASSFDIRISCLPPAAWLSV